MFVEMRLFLLNYFFLKIKWIKINYTLKIEVTHTKKGKENMLAGVLD